MRSVVLLSSLLVLAACAASPPPRADVLQPASPPDPRLATPAQIAAVVHDRGHQAGLKGCYERALRSAGRVTGGRIDVTVSVATSGAVQRVALKAPARLEPVGPCLRNAIAHWVFPANSQRYATNFSLALHGR